MRKMRILMIINKSKKEWIVLYLRTKMRNMMMINKFNKDWIELIV